MREILVLVSLVVLVACAPSKQPTDNEKHFPIDEGQRYANMLMEARPKTNIGSIWQSRFKRRVPEYAHRMIMPEDVYSPYGAPLKNYESSGNPVDNTYEGSRYQDDGVWSAPSNYEDDKSDDGLWFNSVVRPHYELPSARRVKMMENILNNKRFNRRPTADMFY